MTAGQHTVGTRADELSITEVRALLEQIRTQLARIERRIGSEERPAAIPTSEVLTISQAAFEAKKSRDTIMNWCRVYSGLGWKVGGNWVVSKARLDEILAGDDSRS